MNFLLKEIWVYTLAYVIIFPIFIIVFVSNSIFRLILSAAFLWTRHELAPSADNVFKVLSSPATILVVLMCDSEGEPDMAKERTNFKTNVLQKFGADGSLTYAKLRKVWDIQFGYGCWKEDQNFDVKNHVKLITGGSRAKPMTETTFLKEIVPPLTMGMDKTHPQWEWLVIPNILVNGRSSPQTARIFRFHHSYMDGLSFGLMLMDSMLKFKRPHSNTHDKHPFVIDPFLQPKFKTRLILSYEKMSAPLRFPLMFARGMVETPSTPKQPLITKEYSGKVHLANSELLDSKLFQKIKQIHGANASVTCIVTTVLKDSLRKLLKCSKRPREGTFCAVETVKAVLPVPDYKPKNDFMYHSVHFDTKQKGLLQHQPPKDIFVSRFFCNWSTTLPVAVTKALFASGGAGTAYFSNVPFSREEGELWGTPLNEISSYIALYNPIGFAITVIRYGKYFRFSAIAEDACMDREELQQLLDNMAQRVKDMANQD